MDSSQGFKLNDKTNSMLEVFGLRQINSKVTHADTQFLIKTITAFLQKIGIDEEEILNTSHDDLPYQETLNDIIKLINLETTVSEILKDIFIKDLNLNDIMNPEKKRSNKVLRYMSNFCLYIKNKSCELDENLNEVNEKSKKLQELKDEAKKYEEKNAQLVAQTGKLLIENKKSSEEIDERKLSTSKKRIKNMELEKLVNDEKEELEKNKDILMKQQTEYIQHQNYKASVEKNLVTSPNRICHELNMIHKLKENKMSENVAMNEMNLKQNKTLEVQQKFAKNMENLLQKCRECIESSQKYVAVVEDVENLDKQLYEMKSLIKNIKLDGKEDSQQKQHYIENLEQVKVECEQKIEELLKQHSILKSELVDADTELKLNLTEKDKLDNNMKFINDSISKLMENNHSFLQQWKQMYIKEKAKIIELSAKIKEYVEQ